MSTRSQNQLATRVATVLLMALLPGCSALVGRATTPLTARRSEPGVVLCMSERVGGGIRIVGRLEKGIYPITRATLQYKIGSPSEPVPASPASNVLELQGGHAENVSYRNGDDEVAFTIDGDAARALRGKVLWYRWIIEYGRGGGADSHRTDLHRTSLEEAGLPRSAGTPGPDSSVALPSSARRR